VRTFERANVLVSWHRPKTMKRFIGTVAILAVAAGCTSTPRAGGLGVISGEFIRSGGPAGTPNVVLAGTITATPTDTTMKAVSVSVRADGRFSLRVRAGTYTLVGLSPGVQGGPGTETAPIPCPYFSATGDKQIRVQSNDHVTINVVCNIK